MGAKSSQTACSTHTDAVTVISKARRALVEFILNQISNFVIEPTVHDHDDSMTSNMHHEEITEQKMFYDENTTNTERIEQENCTNDTGTTHDILVQ